MLRAPERLSYQCPWYWKSIKWQKTVPTVTDMHEWFCSEEEGTSDVDVLVASYNRAPTQERKVYIACMHISPINVTISFLPAELQRRDHLNPNDITGIGQVSVMHGSPHQCWLHDH